jgi:large subunit ribosomal protein L25
MAKSVLNVEQRVRIGKGGSRKVRRDGLVPAVVYGRGMDALNLRVDPKALKQAIATDAGWNTLITLKGDGAFDGKVVILKDMQLDSIRREVQHVDFLAIDLNKKISVMVPVHPLGKSLGEKEGGTLQLVRHELEVLCLPSDIPTAIEIDVTALKVGDVVHLADVTLPEEVEIPQDLNFTVLTIMARKVEEVEAEEGEEVGEVVAEAEETEED